METQGYSVLEYRYRDAANYKVEGRVLLTGSASAEELQAIRSRLETDDLFVAEQVGLPSLRHALWASSGSHFDSDVDHAWHEFIGLRPAEENELNELEPAGSVAELARAFDRRGPSGG